MAGIMHKTSRLMAAVLLGCLLAGCGGQLLSHREIVRAVFFTAQDVGYTVTLLTSDQPSYQHDPERLYGLSFGGVEVKFKVDGDVLTVVSTGKLKKNK